MTLQTQGHERVPFETERRMRLNRIAVGSCALALVFIVAKAGAAGDRTLKIPYESATKRRAMLIHVRINDTPALLIMDTGSPHTIVQPGVLRKKAGTVSPAQAATNGVGLVGQAVREDVSFQLGQWKSRRAVVIMDLSRILPAYDERIDGLLGLDFLQEFPSVVIDSKAKRSRLQNDCRHPPPAKLAAAWNQRRL